VDDVGCEPDLPAADYPMYARFVGAGVAAGKFDRGILICGTGQGMVIAANKVKGVRAALCLDVLTALFSREHNDANVLCMGGWLVDNEKAEKIALAWLKMPFAEGVHRNRVKMIEDIENER
jgi:ribose 5-phosphate isomerase B